MDNCYRLVPAAPAKSASVKDTSAASAPGVHDTLEFGPRSLAAEVRTEGSLRTRLENWEETQDNLKLTMARNLYGLHAPVRMLMERKLVAHNAHMPAHPSASSNLQLDILMGRDETVEMGDAFLGASMDTKEPLDIHRDMERKLRM